MKPKTKKFAAKILEKQVQIRQASYPESQQFNLELMEIRKTDLAEMIELLQSVKASLTA